MSTDRDTARIVRSWLRTDEHESADRVLQAVLDALDTTPQRRATWWPAGRITTMNTLAKLGLASAILVVTAFLGSQLLRAPAVGEPSPSAAPVDPSPSALPALGLPGARGGSAGEYGWTGALGSRTGMHKVVSEGQTQMIFAVENDCFARGEGAEPVSQTVAGFDSLYVEPYEGPNVLFMPERRARATTGGYQIAIGDRTLCVYLTWDATTTPAELEAAREVLGSIRAQPFGENGIRLVFTLPDGWDTG